MINFCDLHISGGGGGDETTKLCSLGCENVELKNITDVIKWVQQVESSDGDETLIGTQHG